MIFLTGLGAAVQQVFSQGADLGVEAVKLGVVVVLRGFHWAVS